MVLGGDEQMMREYRDYVRLLALVKFHPLSIKVIANLLKTQRLGWLEKQLGEAMVELADNQVLASLQISIERLDAEARKWLPLLEVFHGGAMENILLDITEIPAVEWRRLRPLLENTGLIQVETLDNNSVPYLQFHPSLTTALLLDNENLRHRHQHRYYELSNELYFADDQNPITTRAIVKRELPNLLFAVKGALVATTNYAVKFVDNVNRFLNYFGLQRDLEQLNQQAAKLAGEVGSQNWFLSKSGYGEQLFNAGHYTEAANIFNKILTDLNTTASYNSCLTLGRLGRCFELQGQTEQAVAYYQQGLETAQQLEQNKNVQRQASALYTDLATALRDMGRYAEAQVAYEQSLAIKDGDERGEAVVLGQLGTLALVQGKLAEAEQRYKTALAIFQRFHEPNHEAVSWHQLGYVYKEAKQWEAAEHAYRQAANIFEAQGNLPGAAQTWNNLAFVTENMGKLADAEAWYRKAIEVDKQFGNAQGEARGLSNLANLFQNQPNRLPESQQLAEQALAIKKTLDPAAAEIWLTYELLAQIADKQGNAQEAKKYRRLACETKANFAGTRYELKQKHGQLILMTVHAVENAEVRKNLETQMETAPEQSKNLIDAIQQILAGERDVDKLCEPLHFYDAPIITAILEGIERPESLDKNYRDCI